MISSIEIQKDQKEDLYAREFDAARKPRIKSIYSVFQVIMKR